MLYLIGALQFLITILIWLVIIWGVMSWLVAFNVINTSNQAVRSFLTGLDRLIEPLVRPIRRILPDFGGLDFSPMVLLIVLFLIRDYLLPAIAASFLPVAAYTV